VRLRQAGCPVAERLPAIRYTCMAMNVSLFVACLTETLYPRTGIAVVKVLEHLGCKVDFPSRQTCCGQPMWNAGFRDETEKLAKRMIGVFEDSECVVTPSGSCCAMVRDYYPEIFKGNPDWESPAKALVDKTYEFVELLIKVLKVDLRDLGVKWPGKATYHYSCHLRGIGIRDEVVTMLQQIEGLEYVQLEKMDQCCGFGGMFSVKYPPISGALVRDKVACIAATQAPVVIVNDAGCTMNIEGACRRENVDVKFMSLAEVIAEGLGLMEKDT